MELMAQRALSRKTFGKFIAQHGSFVSDLAKVNDTCVLESSKCFFVSFTYIGGCMIQLRVELEGTRLLVLEAADHLDKFGNKKARGILAMAKVKSALYM